MQTPEADVSLNKVGHTITIHYDYSSCFISSHFSYQVTVCCDFVLTEMATMSLTRPAHQLGDQPRHMASDLMNSLSISTPRHTCLFC